MGRGSFFAKVKIAVSAPNPAAIRSDVGRPFKHLREVELLGPDLSEMKRATEALGSNMIVVQAPMQLAYDRVKQVMRFQAIAMRNLCDGIQRRLWPLQVRDNHRAIQGDDRRWFELIQSIVMPQNARPVRRSMIDGGAMKTRDAPPADGTRSRDLRGLPRPDEQGRARSVIDPISSDPGRQAGVDRHTHRRVLENERS